MICTNTDQYVNALSTIKKEKKKTRKKKERNTCSLQIDCILRSSTLLN